jgi:hypothetical protein
MMCDNYFTPDKCILCVKVDIDNRTNMESPCSINYYLLYYKMNYYFINDSTCASFDAFNIYVCVGSTSNKATKIITVIMSMKILMKTAHIYYSKLLN